MRKMVINEVEIPEGKELLEDFFPLTYVLEESTDGKKPKLKGKFGQVDEATANRRVYPRKVMTRELGRVQTNISERQMYGELDHPSDGKTKLARVSHLISEAALHEDGQITGVIEIIPGTVNGDQALAIARAGGKLGVSSRGFGSTAPDTKGNSVVQEDYTLVTFDLVADPANAGAYPDYVVEHKEGQGMLDLDTLKKDRPDLIEAVAAELKAELGAEARDHARDALREEFEEQLSEATENVREEALEQARHELLSDPEVAGSATAMRAVAKVVRPFILREDEESIVRDMEERIEDAEQRVAEADEARRKAVQESEELAELAKEAFFHLFLERQLRDDDRREQVESILGDVTLYENLDELKERLDGIQKALDEEDEIQEEKDLAVKRLELEKAKLQEELDRALSIGNKIAVKGYIEKSLANHPKAHVLRNVLDEAVPTNAREVDAIIEAYDEEYPVSDEYSRITSDLGLMDDDDEDVVLFEDRKPGGDVLGVDIELLAEMSGVVTPEG